MGANTKIEWTDASWTPIRACNLSTGKVGWHCEHASPGCANCYAEGMNNRLGTGRPFKPGHHPKDIEMFLDEKMLLAPLRWKKPRMIFVCSMTDLFADFVKDEWIDRVFAVMALCPQHTFQVLTKRSERMRDYATGIDKMTSQLASRRLAAAWPGNTPVPDDGIVYPYPNVWFGVSAEDQARADERIPDLLATPAAVRFVSYEPALSHVDYHDWLTRNWHPTMAPETTSRIDWVICGGESGSNATPMEAAWARSCRDQCLAAGVPFFFKQWGYFVEHGQTLADGSKVFTRSDEGEFIHVSKSRAGRLLDGIEHNGMPR